MENQYTYTIFDFLYKYRYAVAALSISFFVILVLTVILVRQNIRFAENRADAKVKGQFLSTMRHKIRTPLNGLIVLNHLMSQKLDDHKQMEAYLRQSTTTANYLLSLVNDILDMSKLQAQKLELILCPAKLEIVFNTVKSIVKNAMSEKDITFNVHTDLNWPYVICDEIRIQQVLLNLLDNARKFTPAGGNVDMFVKQEITKNDKVLTTVTVSDTGRGINEEFQKKIFEVFAQDLGTVSKGNQGTGLGLSISHRLALLMDGDLTCTNRKEGARYLHLQHSLQHLKKIQLKRSA